MGMAAKNAKSAEKTNHELHETHVQFFRTWRLYAFAGELSESENVRAERAGSQRLVGIAGDAVDVAAAAAHDHTEGRQNKVLAAGAARAAFARNDMLDADH